VRAVVVAALGALVGTLAERVHRRAGVWELPDGGPLPPWVTLAYFVGLYAAALAFRRFERGRALSVPPARAAAEALFVLALFGAPPLLHAHEARLAALASAVLVARLLVERAPGDVAVAFAVAGADVALEGGLVAAGLFRYREAAAPLPLWLAPLWGAIGLGLRRLFRFVGVS
jgi:hypothetical protein